MSEYDYLDEYEGRLGSRRFTNIAQLQLGDLVQFLYRGEMRLGLVMAPNYKDKLHVISLKEIPHSSYIEMVKNVHPLPASPQELYGRVRQFSLDFLSYRQYLHKDITQLRKILPKVVTHEKNSGSNHQP